MKNKINGETVLNGWVFRVLIICLIASSCSSKKQPPSLSNKDISNVITAMTTVMVHDITNPPLAARFYAYTCLAGYEVIVENDKNTRSMKGILNEYPDIEKPAIKGNISYQLAALVAMLETAKKMQPSGPLMDKYETHFMDSCRTIGFDEDIIERSRNYGQAISRQILAYAKTDHYNQISNLARYTPVKGEGNWYPTPPGFLEAVEPRFNTVRPFTLDSAACFKSLPPAVFSTEKNSPFYQLMDAVYREGKNHVPEHIAIASFWDCNPFAVQDDGHLMFAFKKISPGAHWLGISGIACIKANKSFDETLLIHTAVSIGLMDAFICCWDEKYRSNRIRPETAIRKLIDPTWEPLLQTPPFPEYLSGHSVASASSSTILTHYFGDHFSYTDSVEVSYGIPARSFDSFKEAADQAAISRFYGGIHFMDANTRGLEQGTKVGELVLKKMKD
jgi:hypothetical protein